MLHLRRTTLPRQVRSARAESRYGHILPTELQTQPQQTFASSRIVSLTESLMLLFSSLHIVSDNLPSLHHEKDAFQCRDVFQWVPRDCDYIGELSGF